MLSLNASCRKDTDDYVETKIQSITENYIWKATLFHATLNVSNDSECFQQARKTKDKKSSREHFIIYQKEKKSWYEADITFTSSYSCSIIIKLVLYLGSGNSCLKKRITFISFTCWIKIEKGVGGGQDVVCVWSVWIKHYPNKPS